MATKSLLRRALPVLACLLAAACGKAATQAQQQQPGIQAHVALTAVTSCDQLSKSVQDAAWLELKAQLESMKTQSGGPVVAEAGGAASNGAPSSAPASYTTTNVQVAGVDEADFMKNDGTRIFVLSEGALIASSSWPPKALSVQGRLPIEGWPEQMFLSGDRAVVLSSVWTTDPQAGNGGGGSGIIACPMMMGKAAGAAIGAMCRYGSSTTKVTIVDVSAMTAMKVIGELWLPGYAAHARRVGPVVRLVLSDNLRWPAGVKWWPDWDPAFATDRDKWAAAIDALEAADEKIIRATPAQKWFPPGQRKLEDGSTVDVGYQCSDFFVSTASQRPGLLSVVTLDLDHPEAPPTRASIVAEAGIVYATPETLYVAGQHWWWWDAPGQRDQTYLHAFDISGAGRATYLASGGVAGHVLDQFSLDEDSGVLRVAATTVERISANSWETKIGAHVATLSRKDADLVNLGDSGELAAGESIRSARFVGGRGFVVTFKNLDPLITVDLSDAAHPRKVAELTLPGFSSYLQPIDDGHLLAIGTDLPPLDPITGQADWSKRSLQLSVFDVRDLAHPVRSAQRDVGTMYAWSEALYDHHAFNWYGQRGLLAIPFSDWLQNGAGPWYDRFVSDVRVYDVKADAITPRGALGMDDVYVQVGYGQWSYRYQPYVRRSVLATDDAGLDYVYAVSDAGLRVAAINDLKHPIATARFPTPAN